MAVMSTLFNWAAFLGLVGFIAYYYDLPALLQENKPRKQQSTASRPQLTQTQSSKRTKPKRTLATRAAASQDGTSTPVSSNEGTSSKKRKIISTPVGPQVTATTTNGQDVKLPRDEDSGMSNREFAQQLARTQSGTKLEPTAKQTASTRTVKAKTSKTPQSSGLDTESSSTTGRDADDDLSASSPQSGPVSTESNSRAGDISDMLETPAAKPTTLRLTDVSEGNSKINNKNNSKVFEPALSKKQRQRQARAEENRALREEADRIQEAKKQEQMRKARMAEGTSNQTKANSFTVTSQNPWQPKKVEQRAGLLPEIPTTPLLDTLDTFDDVKARVNEESAAVPMASASNNSVTTRPATGPSSHSNLSSQTRQNWADEMSEEDQLKLLKEQANDNAWESVTTKKSKKGFKKDNDTSSEASGPAAAPINFSKPLANGSHINGSAYKRPEYVNRFDSVANYEDNGLKDSEW